MKNMKKNLNLGIRKVSTMNFSKVVTLPKTFTDNFLDKGMRVYMTMGTDGKLTLTPIKGIKSNDTGPN